MKEKKSAKKKGDHETEKKLYTVAVDDVQFCSRGIMVRVNEYLYVLIEGAQYGIDPGDSIDWTDDDEFVDEIEKISLEEIEENDDPLARLAARRWRDEEELRRQASDAVKDLHKRNAIEKVNKLADERNNHALKAVNEHIRSRKPKIKTQEDSQLDPSLL